MSNPARNLCTLSIEHALADVAEAIGYTHQFDAGVVEVDLIAAQTLLEAALRRTVTTAVDHP